MKIGVCGGIDRIRGVAENGFDYLEGNFRWIACCTDDEFAQFKNELDKYSVRCEAANCFFPGELKITGENIDYDAISDYLKKGFERAAELGIKVVVLGSGAARNIPEGYSYDKACRDIINVVKNYIAPLAEKYGIEFVFEPLCKAESNIINTIKEGAMLASAIDCKNVGTLGDIYHMYVEGDTYEDLKELNGVFRHAHISNPRPDDDKKKRCYMKSKDEYDYKGFFDALKYVGCERVSIEADTDDFYQDVSAAAEIMKMYK